jgi:gluconolactonase
LCLSPDHRFLYVNDTPRQHIRRFEVEPDGRLTGGEVFVDFPQDGPHSLDGMECDELGNVWVTGPGGIWAIDPDGVKIGSIPVPERAGSLAWGGASFDDLYITAKTTLYRLRTTVRGYHPFVR